MISEWTSGFMSVSAVRDALLNLDAAVARLRALPVEERAHQVLDKHVARASPPHPLKHGNPNRLDRHSFTATPPREGPRPLRDLATVHLDEEGDAERGSTVNRPGSNGDSIS